MHGNSQFTFSPSPFYVKATKNSRPRDKVQVSRRFRTLRQRSRLAQRQLAELIGICRQAVSEIEGRHVMPHLSTWNRFVDLEKRHEEARQVSASMEPFFWR